MIPVQGCNGLRVAVLGLGRSGLAAAHALRAGGAAPLLWDDSAPAREKAEGEGFTLRDLRKQGAFEDVAALIISPGIPHLYPAPNKVIAAAYDAGVPVDNEGTEFELEDGRVVAAWFSGWRCERTASASPQTDEAESEAANEAAYLGEPAVGLTPEIFAPDVLSLEDRYEYGIAISADGLQSYFGVAGDERAEIRSVEYAEGEWSTDRPVLPDATFSFNDTFLSSDQKRLYFISDAALTGEGRKQDHDIWYVERREKGWSDLIHGGAELNTSFEEYFVSLTDDGTLYFASNRPKPPADSWGGGFDLYASPSADGSFQSAQRLPAALNTEHYEADVFVAPDESYVIFCATRPDGLGRGDLYISFRGSDGEWSTAKSVGDAINTDSHELCPFVSRDGRFFFYTSNEDIYWVDARVLESFR